MPHHREHHSASRRYESYAPTPAPSALHPHPRPAPIHRRLTRRPRRRVPRARIRPAEFIRHGLRTKTPQMMAGIAALASSHLPTSLPRSHLPPALTIPSALCPLLRIRATRCMHSPSGRPQASTDKRWTHINPSSPCTRSCWPRTASSSRVFRPLRALPPRAILHAFMYTHRLDAALSALLPLPSSFIESLGARRAHPHRGHPRRPLRAADAARIERASELWQDMVSLGLYDAELWDAGGVGGVEFGGAVSCSLPFCFLVFFLSHVWRSMPRFHET
ncbi:hypothetical protein C8R43DRAFT_1190680 [Mycena crocata]|nr:hypothetical protein C8R43DRAFT_1190680 [Mycena crocata]